MHISYSVAFQLTKSISKYFPTTRHQNKISFAAFSSLQEILTKFLVLYVTSVIQNILLITHETAYDITQRNMYNTYPVGEPCPWCLF